MKILYISPHLSTGGLPQYLLKQVQYYSKTNDVYVIENDNISNEFVVQKTHLRDILGEKLITIHENKKKILNVIDDIKPDIIHFQEIPEHFLHPTILVKIFSSNRPYTIVVTTHSSKTEPKEIIFKPDGYVLVSKWSKKRFEVLDIPCEIWEYPIEKLQKDKVKSRIILELPEQKHILNVGLFTPGKNQVEIFEVASLLPEYTFHFVGNLAENFRYYWEYILKHKPNNCIIWRERSDVDVFYQACDIFYFSSRYELMPLALKEAISYGMPTLCHKLETYEDEFDGVVHYINDYTIEQKVQLLKSL